MKFTCEFKLPNICGSPLITREIEIDDKKFERVGDKDMFIKFSFLHAISEEMVIDYKKIG